MPNEKHQLPYCRECWELAAPDRRYCERHLRIDRERQRRRRNIALFHGWCEWPGCRSSPQEGCRWCPVHEQWWKSYRLRRKKRCLRSR